MVYNRVLPIPRGREFVSLSMLLSVLSSCCFSCVLHQGYNVVFFGDWWQLPPIPDSAALFKPPPEKCTARAKLALNIFWGAGSGSINFLAELTEQKRVEDDWYNSLLMSCRDGKLDDESYQFLMGLPTRHCGSWRSDTQPPHAACGSRSCAALPLVWAHMSKQGAQWSDMVSMECDACRLERDRRCRVVSTSDPRVKQDPIHSCGVHSQEQ